MLTDGKRYIGRDSANQVGQLLCILRTVTVGDANLLIRETESLLLILCRQRLDRSLAAPDLGTGNNMTGAVPVEDRFDAQNCADGCGEPADTSRPLEEIQVIHGKILAGVLHFCRDCKSTIKEFDSYSWKEDASVDTVIKENDHAMDELRYFCYTILRDELMFDI